MKKVNVVLTSLILLSTIACKKDKTVEPDPTSVGDIKGTVILYDEDIEKVGFSGMKVSIEGISSKYYDITDENGAFDIKDVPAGTYNLIYEKEGFGTYKNISIEHLAKNGESTFVKDTPSLGQKSSTSIVALSAATVSEEVHLSIATEPSSNNADRRYIRIFYHDELGVSKSVYTCFSNSLGIQINPFVKKITKKELNDLGFSSGTKVYVKVYGDSYWSNTYEENDITEFPNLNAISADAITIEVP